MNYKSIIKLMAAVALMATAPACEEDETGSGSGSGSSDLFATSTKLYKGYSLAFGETYDGGENGLILYKTKTPDEYWIPYFFKGTAGDVAFFMNSKTNEIEMEETYTGITDENGPVYILSQKSYLAEMGDKAEKSYYDPINKSFVFNVLIASADAYGNMVTTTSVLKYYITETITE